MSKHHIKGFIRQWFFPAKSLTFVKQDKEYRRYHLHKTHVQRAIKKAVTKARITNAAAPVLFATATPAICWKQISISARFKLLGHKDVRTTMIYTPILLNPNRLRKPKAL